MAKFAGGLSQEVKLLKMLIDDERTLGDILLSSDKRKLRKAASLLILQLTGHPVPDGVDPEVIQLAERLSGELSGLDDEKKLNVLFDLLLMETSIWDGGGGEA
jgi:hypothetical protein